MIRKRKIPGRELVLRAMERRASFQSYAPLLDSLTRQVGLFPYLEADDLGFRDRLAYELHTVPLQGETFVFHRAQAEVYRRLMAGDNVILSAPTSFGKSRIIDAVIASGQYSNIAVVVPTIALIDETRRRLSVYRNRYKLVTQVAQSPAERNIFVFTAERLNAYEQLPHIDFFVIDEFYKLGAMNEDESRTVALNQAFYRLRKGGGKFYLLGPSIKPDSSRSSNACLSQRVSPRWPARRFQFSIGPMNWSGWCTFAEISKDQLSYSADRRRG
jgi:hypothetical protein